MAVLPLKFVRRVGLRKNIGKILRVLTPIRCWGSWLVLVCSHYFGSRQLALRQPLQEPFGACGFVSTPRMTKMKPVIHLLIYGFHLRAYTSAGVVWASAARSPLISLYATSSSMVFICVLTHQ
jgi:hypothetical protein